MTREKRKHDPAMHRRRQLGPLFGHDDRPAPNKQARPREEGNRHARRAQEKKQPRMHYEVPIASPEETEFRHAHWKPKRERLLNLLPTCGTTKTALEAFQNCGAAAYVFKEMQGDSYRLQGSYCHSRHCEPCMKAKANLLRQNLEEKLADRKEFQYRFITLTLKHSDTPLRDQIDRLYASFKALRATKFWKANNRGGCIVLEVKWMPDTGEWHPHLHIMADGDHMHADRLSQEWHAITGDSYVTKINLMKTGHDASFYVAKYVGKGCNAELYWNTAAAQEYICAIKGTRTCATYGNWRGFKLLKKPNDDRKWTCLGSLAGYITQANEGNRSAIYVLDKLTESCQYNPHRKRSPRPEAKSTLPTYTIPSTNRRE